MKQNNVVNLLEKYPERFQSISIYETDNLKLNNKDVNMLALNTAIAETTSELFALICTKLNIF